MPARDRGFTRQPTGRLALPGLPHAPGGLPLPPGAPAPPREEGITEASLQPYPDPPPDWTGPLTEWVVYWYLTVVRKARPGVDFLYQEALPVPGYLASGRGFRSDFWILPEGKFGNPAGADYPRGLVLDPFSFFTHPPSGLDLLRKALLARSGFFLVWLEDVDLERAPRYYVGEALRGVDHSPLARR